MIGVLTSNGGNSAANAIMQIIPAVLGMFSLVVWIVIVSVFMLIMIASTVFVIIINWKMLEKAGEQGWKCLIPFYSMYTFLDISVNKKTKDILFIASLIATVGCFIPYLNVIISPLASPVIYASNGFMHFAIARSFGMDTVLCILAIFFPPIVTAMIVFGKYEYTGDKLVLFKD